MFVDFTRQPCKFVFCFHSRPWIFSHICFDPVFTMMPRFRRSEAYDLLPTTSWGSPRSSSSDYEYYGQPPAKSKCLQVFKWLCFRLPLRLSCAVYSKILSLRGSHRSLVRGIVWAVAAAIGVIVLLIIFTAAFRPSYTHLPEQYRALQRRCRESKVPGRGNINQEKIFIAATLHDVRGTLVGGDWGDAVLKLVDLLGPENVYLSVYENDADPLAKASLEVFEKKLSCKPQH